ncbi:MAG: hypothetical protein ACF8OB_01415 [Phycisphaeraceae bacterium JB051]
MFEIFAIRTALGLVLTGTLAASVTIVDRNSLVPIGLLVSAVTGAVIITWKVASAVTNARRDNDQLRKDNEDLKQRVADMEAKLNG